MENEPINNLPDKQDADERGVAGAASVTNEDEINAVELDDETADTNATLADDSESITDET